MLGRGWDRCFMTIRNLLWTCLNSITIILTIEDIGYSIVSMLRQRMMTTPRSNANLLAGSWQYPWWKNAAVELCTAPQAKACTSRTERRHIERRRVCRLPYHVLCHSSQNRGVSIQQDGAWFGDMLICQGFAMEINPSDLLAQGWEDPLWCEGRGSWPAKIIKTYENNSCCRVLGCRCITYYECKHFYSHLRWGACRSS